MILFKKGRPLKECNSFLLVYKKDSCTYIEDGYFDSDNKLCSTYIYIDRWNDECSDKIEILGYYLKEDLIKQAGE